MFRNALVGVNGHLGNSDAVGLAKELLHEGGELTLAHIYPGDARIWGESGAEYSAVERERALKLLTQVRDQGDVNAQLRYEESASVGRGLHELAEAVGADLLVVGSSVNGLRGRVLLGDDARAALNGAPCAVAIAPSGYSRENATIREIGVAYNGSPESDNAISVARKLAAKHGAKLSAFEAVSIPTYAFLAGPVPIENTVEGLVRQARERITALGDVEPHAAYGNAAEELALYSASIDLLVVGSRDYGPIGRLMHGSTSHQLARTARCPLLALTRAARAADGSDPSQHELDAEAAARD